MQSWV